MRTVVEGVISERGPAGTSVLLTPKNGGNLWIEIWKTDPKSGQFARVYNKAGKELGKFHLAQKAFTSISDVKEYGDCKLSDDVKKEIVVWSNSNFLDDAKCWEAAFTVYEFYKRR